MNGAALVNGLSDAERLALMGRIYDLLRRQTAKYLAGDSTSLPVETAGELLRSMTYTLRLALSEAGRPERELLTGDLAELLGQGQRILQNKLSAAHELWERACLTLPQIPNGYLQDTLKGISGFFKRYDLRYFAHQIPCSLDYPLCLPVSEELPGVSYVEQWLRQLLIENWLLSRFQQAAVRRLLSKIAPDYEEAPLNMCEQPLINAVGLALLRRSVFSLALSDEDCREIEGLLFGCPDIEEALNRGVAAVTAALRAPKEAEDYMQAVLSRTLPRIRSAGRHGGINGVFIAS